MKRIAFARTILDKVVNRNSVAIKNNNLVIDERTIVDTSSSDCLFRINETYDELMVETDCVIDTRCCAAYFHLYTEHNRKYLALNRVTVFGDIIEVKPRYNNKTFRILHSNVNDDSVTTHDILLVDHDGTDISVTIDSMYGQIRAFMVVLQNAAESELHKIAKHNDFSNTAIYMRNKRERALDIDQYRTAIAVEQLTNPDSKFVEFTELAKPIIGMRSADNNFGTDTRVDSDTNVLLYFCHANIAVVSFDETVSYHTANMAWEYPLRVKQLVSFGQNSKYLNVHAEWFSDRIPTPIALAYEDPKPQTYVHTIVPLPGVKCKCNAAGDVVRCVFNLDDLDTAAPANWDLIATADELSAAEVDAHKLVATAQQKLQYVIDAYNNFLTYAQEHNLNSIN